MSNKGYHEIMSELYHTRALMFALFAILMYGDYGLCPAFACMLFATIASVISMIIHMRRAND